jgi:hypothetical protein
MRRQATWICEGLLGLGLLLAAPGFGAAQTFVSGSTGADGAFNPTCAPTPCTVTVALPPSGVFNFTTITIPTGVTVAFQNNAANTPVIMLATGDVTIAGTILLDGQPGGDAVAGIVSSPRAGRGGSGGFNGGEGSKGLITTVGGQGLGPGGGSAPLGPIPGGFFCTSGGGGFATQGRGGCVAGGQIYGSAALLPLIGGSGGGGGFGNTNFDTAAAGGGGGGAIVIASSTRIVLTRNILARGGRGGNSAGVNVSAGSGGSGGAVRLIANTLEGSGGLISVAGGAAGVGNVSSQSGGEGGQGYIRLEGFDIRLVASFSATPSLAKPGSVFLPSPPALRIGSVAGVTAPAAPTGDFGAPDVVLPASAANPVTVNITASRVPLGTAVQLTVIPFNGEPTTATSTGLSGTTESSTASATVTIPRDQPAILRATATFTLLASAGGGPIYADGEEVKWVRVAATYGGSSAVTYITASGKEIPPENTNLLMSGAMPR